MKKESSQASIIKSFLNKPNNRRCADCTGKNPQWASTKLGVFVCIRCSGLHRSLGTDITFVRSTDLDTWKEEYLDLYSKIDNAIANDYWEAKLPTDFIRPTENTSSNEVLFFIKNKYVKKVYCDLNVENPVTLILEGRFKLNNNAGMQISQTQTPNQNENLINKKGTSNQKEVEKGSIKMNPITEKFQAIQTSKINEDLINAFEFNESKGVNKGKNILLKINSDNNIISGNSIDTKSILDLYKQDNNGNSKESNQNKYAAFEKLPIGAKANCNNSIPSYVPLMGLKNSNNYSNPNHAAIKPDLFISKWTSIPNTMNAPVSNSEHFNSLSNGTKNYPKKEGAFEDLLAYV